MDILILDSWLREFLDTNASPKDIAKCLSLCGPSIEKTENVKIDNKEDFLYHIEVTTNRVDMMSVKGIAREASVILPEFGFKAKLIEQQIDKGEFSAKSDINISFKTDFKIVSRMIGVVLEIPKIEPSKKLISDRLESAGIRSLNNVVDITNYIMTEIGHPSHVFDFDLVKPQLLAREAKKGEMVTSFDGKEYKLPGGDIVFENKEGVIVDLPGIIGTKNSVVNENTKRILFFIETNDPVRIRKTSMTLGVRTVAATLNEKHVDPNLAEIAIKRGLYLYKKLINAKQLSPIIDVYKPPVKSKAISVDHDFIEKLMGVEVSEERVLNILSRLEISTTLDKKNHKYLCTPPSFRSNDLQIPEDVVEEVARIYGYHKLPSKIMTGEIPEPISPIDFTSEKQIKHILKETGANEIYNYSLTNKGDLKIKNPLGEDYSYLRNNLFDSLINAVNENKRETEAYHLFEMANVYLTRKENLPDERLMLAGIFYKYSYRHAKGVIETLLNELGIKFEFCLEKNVIQINPVSGRLKIVSGDLIYYEFEIEKLLKYKQFSKKYTPISQFPPQIEDITLMVKNDQLVGNVIKTIYSTSSQITNVELVDTYERNFTFRIWYQDPDKTLTDKEVEDIRKKIKANFN